MTATALLAMAAMRIISLSPATTEDLFAIGAARDVIGIDRYATRPTAVARYKRYGGIFDANAEIVLAAEPTLVLFQAPNEPAMNALREAGLDVVGVPGLSLADDWRDIATIGRLTGRSRQADLLIARLRAHIATRAREVAHERRLRVLLLSWQSPVYTYAKGTFVDDLLRLANLENVAEDAGTPWPALSADFIATAKPDVLILADEQYFRFSDAIPPFDFIAAARDHRIAHLHDELDDGPYVDRLFDAIVAAVAPYR